MNIISSDNSIQITRLSPCDFNIKGNANGASFSLFKEDTSTVSLSGLGVSLSKLKADVRLSTNPQNRLILDGTGLLVLPDATQSTDMYVKVSGSDSTSGYLKDKLVEGSFITLQQSSGANKNIKISVNTTTLDARYTTLINNAFTNLPTLTPVDSTTIDFTSSGNQGHTITGSVKLEPTSTNAISISTGGLFSPKLEVQDSSTVDLIQSGANTLTAFAKISPSEGNVLIDNEGLYVAEGNYILPTATSNTLGGVKIGNNINVDTDGVISVTFPTIVLPSTTDDIAEAGNLYFTVNRSREAISLSTMGTSGVATYNPTTGVLNVPNYSTIPTTVNWLGVNYLIGDGGTVTLPAPIYTTSQVAEGLNLYYTDTRSRNAIALTTAGTSGPATYSQSTGILNIPDYTFTPTPTPLTWLGTTYSVGNGGAVTLPVPTTSQVNEGSNLYYTDTRARAAISLTTDGSGAATYNTTTGVFNIPTNISSGSQFVFENDLPVKLKAGDSMGKYHNGDVIPSQGKGIEEVMLDIVTDIFPPTGLLIGTPPPTPTEVGTALDLVLSGVYTQNDGDPLSSTVLYKNGSQISASLPYTDNGVVMSKSNISYHAVFNGNVNTNTITYVGLYKVFAGPVASIPTTSANVRSLAGVFENQEFILNTGTTLINFAFWIPNNKGLQSVVDLDALNLNITIEYIVSNLSVNDAGGTPVAGKLYYKQQSVPYTTNHRHLITITDI